MGKKPGIKTAIVLACTGGTNYTQFRELRAVDDHITSISLTISTRINELRREARGLPQLAATFLASFAHPPSKLNRHLDVLAELFDKVEMLESIHTQLAANFPDTGKAAGIIASLERLIISSKARVDKALTALSFASDKHMPEYFRVCVNKLVQSLRTLPAFSSLRVVPMMRVIEKDEEIVGTQFSVYLCFRNLEDSTGYVHPKFHVVLSCVVDRYGQYSMNFCTQHNLLLPGKFKGVDGFSSFDDCTNKLKTRLSEEGFNWSKGP